MTDKVDIAALRQLIAENAAGGLAFVPVWSDELTALLDKLAALREVAKPSTLRPMESAKDQGPVLAWHRYAEWLVVKYDDDLSPEYLWAGGRRYYATDEFAGWTPLPPNPEVP